MVGIAFLCRSPARVRVSHTRSDARAAAISSCCTHNSLGIMMHDAGAVELRCAAGDARARAPLALH